MTLRAALQKLRREAGRITQAEAAKRVGAPRETWNKWESKEGKRDLSAYYARVIEERFDLEDGALEQFVEPRQAAAPDEVSHLEQRIDRLEERLDVALSELADHAAGQAAPK